MKKGFKAFPRETKRKSSTVPEEQHEEDEENEPLEKGPAAAAENGYNYLQRRKLQTRRRHLLARLGRYMQSANQKMTKKKNQRRQRKHLQSEEQRRNKKNQKQTRKTKKLLAERLAAAKSESKVGLHLLSLPPLSKKVEADHQRKER